MKKIFILLSVLAFLGLAACSSAANTVTSSGVIAPLDPLDYDWEDINIEGGDVEHGFHFTNDGDEDLILTGAVTSCMCTSAYFELPDGSISPSFGMHGNETWSYAVKPGEEFELEVTFDPMAHGPNGVGQIQRGIILNSSAGDTELKVSANVLSSTDYSELYGDSDFVFEESEFDFGVLKQSGGEISHDFTFKYMGDSPITVTGVPTSCACTSAEISKTYFEPGDTGVLTVTFDPNLHEEPEGKFFKTVSILTDPELDKQPEVKVWVEMDLDLGPEFYKLSEEHSD